MGMAPLKGHLLVLQIFFFNVNQDSQGSEKSHNNLFTF